ncbi:MAG TPA: TlyA family RNA methyltransferase [Acidimicrobiia bacterium]|nr:TlyA family RNA methyltransferase [Acidimicrobiia bacterium]
MRRRLDVELVRRRIVTSRAKAVSAIEEGHVLVSGAVADKPARLVAPGEPIELVEAQPYVSRGGFKLAGALDRFGLDVAGRWCIDVGSSTGGFTDCLLQRGAAHVVALDVGRGQLDWSLRQDSRVTVVEGVNVRRAGVDDVGGRRADVVTADLSFISLTTVAGALVDLAAEGADLVLLVKPQFEAGRADVGKGGIVRDPAIHRRVLAEHLRAFSNSGLTFAGLAPSSIRGSGGNVEFVAWWRHGGAAPGNVDAEAAIEAVLVEVEETGGER